MVKLFAIFGPIAAFACFATSLATNSFAQTPSQVFSSTKHGFSVRYPAGWLRQQTKSKTIILKIGHQKGLSCNVIVNVRHKPRSGSALAILRRLFLIIFAKQDLSKQYPPEYKAKISPMKDAKLGGLEAKRFETRFLFRGSFPIRVRQWTTYGATGPVILSCAGRAAVFSNPDSQDAFRFIHISFAFQPHKS